MTIASKSTVLHRMACSLSLPLPFLPLSSPASPSLSLPPPLFLPLSPFPLYLVSCPTASCQLRERRTAKDCMGCMWWKYVILVALPSLALHISEDVNHSVIIHREPGRERGRRREREREGGTLRFTCSNINLLQKGVGWACYQWVELQEREQGRNWERQQVMKLHLK